MGVFALFRRKSAATVEAGTGTVTPAEAGTEADAEAGGTAAVTDEAPQEDAPAAAEAVDGAAEAVEIPRQQSAEAAADNEPAGEGARP